MPFGKQEPDKICFFQFCRWISVCRLFIPWF